MGEDGNVVSFLKGFTDRAFADHLLRTGRANTLGTAVEVALEKEAQRKKEHQVMDEEPMEVGAAHLGFWKPCSDTWGNYRPVWTSRSPAQLPAPR